MKRSSQKGATFIEAALSLSLLFSIALGTLSLASSIKTQQNLTEALNRAAMRISRISSTHSQSSAPERYDIRCAVYGGLIQEELGRESISSARIYISPPPPSDRATFASTRQVIEIKLAQRPLFGRPTAKIQIATPHFDSPVDCNGNGALYMGNGE